MHGSEFQITWKNQNVMSGLDYFLVPIGTFGVVNQCKILPAILSDHCPVVIQVKFNAQICGPGYWKFNTRYLHDKEYVDEVNQILNFGEYRYEDLNPLNKQEMIKHDIKQFSIEYSFKTKGLKKKS